MDPPSPLPYPSTDIICWEALDPDDAALGAARRLYETTLAAAERIPWRWIAGGVASRRTWRPGRWSPHLLLAGPRAGDSTVVGFAYGAHVPEYGGYACYLGVSPRWRRRGTGTRLMQTLSRVFQVDAACEGVPLPFVVWESHRPEPGAPDAEWELWRTRLRLFERLGAWWIAGLDFLAPNFGRRRGPPVRLQLFLIPMDVPATAFGPDELRAVAAGLLEGVYGQAPGSPLFDGTLRPDMRPTLRPVRGADRGKEG